MRHSGRAPMIAAAALTVAAAVAGVAAWAAGSPRSMPLDEAIALALRTNESILVERESLAAAQEAVRGAEGAYDPLLEGQATYIRQSPPINSEFSGAPPGDLAPTNTTGEARASLQQLLTTGGTVSFRTRASRDSTNGAFTTMSPAYSTQAGVEFRQPLWRNRATDTARIRIRAANADRAGAAASVQREVTDTVAAVSRAYWTLAGARAELGVRDEAVKLAEQQLHETDVRVQGGASPETEIAQPRAELERRRGELYASREAVARAENDLKLLILGDTESDIWSEPLETAETQDEIAGSVDVSEAMARALAARPEVRTAEALVERRKAEAALARESVRRALDAIVSYDRYGLAGLRNPRAVSFDPNTSVMVPSRMEGGWGRSTDLIKEGDFYDFRMGALLQVPLGNRAAKANAGIALTAQRQAELEVVRARKAIRAEVLDAAVTLETAGQRIEAARAGREAAVVQLSAEEDRFGAGLSTNFLVLTRQNDLSRARLEEIQALNDYRKARVELARATGSLLEDRGIEIEEPGKVAED